MNSWHGIRLHIRKTQKQSVLRLKINLVAKELVEYNLSYHDTFMLSLDFWNTLIKVYMYNIEQTAYSLFHQKCIYFH